MGKPQCSSRSAKGDEKMSGTQIGKITHFFDHISVAVLKLIEPLRIGDTIHILGHLTDFKQEVTSLQIEHQPVNEAKPGDDVAMKVIQRVHPHDKVFKLTDE
jgi:translation elongation factor EF-1alpha